MYVYSSGVMGMAQRLQTRASQNAFARTLVTFSSAQPAGGSLNYDGDYGFRSGITLTIIATQESGNLFDGWTGTAADAGRLGANGESTTTYQVNPSGDTDTVIGNFRAE